jgi:imidazolonepropionase-like amidohydrolase
MPDSSRASAATSIPSAPSIVAITGGYVVPISADPIEAGTVIIENGVITAVGADVAIPDGATVVDAAGKWVLPGFLEPHSHAGISEEANGLPGADVNETTEPNMAGVRAIDAVNIDDEGFRDALSGGITSMVIKPGSGNAIGGQTVAIKTWGGRTIDEQVIKEAVSIKSALGENPKVVYGPLGKTPMTRMGIAYIIRQAFAEAIAYDEQRKKVNEGGLPPKPDLHLEALIRVLDGELIWDQHVHRHDDIATAIRLADEFGYRLVINHGTEGNKLADVLAERDIPVIFGPMLTARTKVELRDRAVTNLVDMAAAGVRVAFTTDHPVIPINLLVHQATLSVKEGLPRQTALEALTVNPAAMLGLDSRVGALTPGLDGDVVIWSADPLDINARVEQVFISGARVYRWDPQLRRGRTVERVERFGAAD